MNDLIISEVWKDIPEYEGSYQISNLGNVKALSRSVKGYKSKYFVPTRLKKKTVNKVGYEVVVLHKNNKPKTVCIHRLVAEAFIANPNHYTQVNHIDGNKLNNDISNLEWCNNQMNVIHAYRTGLSMRNKPIECVELGLIFQSQQKAADYFGVTQSTIGYAVRNGYRSCGYRWRFKTNE